MGIGSAVWRFVERRLFGGTAEDYAGLMARTAADFELPHDDPELEATLPRSGLGRPLATWSYRPGQSARAFSDSTWFHETSDRALHAPVLEATGRSWADISIAATCRLDPSDDLDRCVQATRYRGAGEAALRGARQPAPAGRREVAGVALDVVDRVRVRALPALEQESNGYRLVRGDTVFEIMGRDEVWLADVVDQLVNGWRGPLPTVEVAPPEGWIVAPLTAADVHRVAALIESASPERAELVRSAIALAEPGSMLFGVDTHPGSAAQVTVLEFPSWPVSFREEMEDWRRTSAELFGRVDLEYVDVPTGPAARLSFRVGDPANPGFGQPWIVRVGARSFRFDFLTSLDRRDDDEPSFGALVRSMRPLEPPA
jgi:hypothetical protein